jgi:hypothetical protein
MSTTATKSPETIIHDYGRTKVMTYGYADHNGGFVWLSAYDADGVVGLSMHPAKARALAAALIAGAEHVENGSAA